MVNDQSLSPSDRPELRAAMAAWERLAAFAWDQYQARGRGVLILDGEELRTLDRDADASAIPQPTYLPASMIPAGDDFLPILRSYDPERQILLLTTQPDGEEILLALEAAGNERPSPAICSQRSKRP